MDDPKRLPAGEYIPATGASTSCAKLELAVSADAREAIRYAIAVPAEEATKQGYTAAAVGVLCAGGAILSPQLAWPMVAIVALVCGVSSLGAALRWRNQQPVKRLLEVLPWRQGASTGIVVTPKDDGK